jgi:hypothetical protein
MQLLFSFDRGTRLALLDTRIYKVNKLYRPLCCDKWLNFSRTRRALVLHTRLRLGFCALNDYLYKTNCQCVTLTINFVQVILRYVFVAWNVKLLFLLSIISYYVPVLLLNVYFAYPCCTSLWPSMASEKWRCETWLYVERIQSIKLWWNLFTVLSNNLFWILAGFASLCFVTLCIYVIFPNGPFPL